MAIDRIKEGFSEYLNRAEQERREQLAAMFENAVNDLRSGAVDFEEVGSRVAFASDDLRTMHSAIGDIRLNLKAFIALITEKFQVARIGLPPAEILQGLPYEVSFSQPEVSDMAVHSQQDIIERGEREIMIEKIYEKLGIFDNYVIPKVPGEDDPLGPPIEVLDLSVNPYNSLRRAGFVRVGNILDISRNEFAGGIRNFGPKCSRETLEALYRFGVRPKEESLVIPQDSVPAHSSLSGSD